MKSHTHHVLGLVAIAVFTAGALSATAQRGQPNYWPTQDSLMSGTYELEGTRGGDPRRTAEMATRSMPPGLRDRAYQSLLSRLEPPYMLSIERRGRNVEIESSRGPRSAFEADGNNRSERGSNGRTMTTRAEIVGNQVRVTSSGGSRGSDFSVTFESLENGRALRVTRRLDDDDLPRPVTIQSYYRRTAPLARWDVYSPGPGYDPRYDMRSGYGSTDGIIVVRDGERLWATLDTPLSMRTSRSGAAFSMTVRGPAEFEGARISGVITRVNTPRGGRDNGDMRVDFHSIQLRGRSSAFDAILNTVRLADGTLLRVNDEGEYRGNDRRDMVQNGALGAAVGAIIGAIAGGGKGAAIGALVGGTGGVILSLGHEELDLPRGADVTLTAVTPYRSTR